MKITFNNFYFIKNSNIGANMFFGQNPVNDNEKMQTPKIDHSDPKEYEQDVLLGREIQKLRKAISNAKKIYANTSDIETKSQLSKEINNLKDKKDTLVEELFSRHLAFATKVASQDFFTESNHSDWDDIISYARLGMLRAAERFDPDKNPSVYFTAYSTKAIKNEIIKGQNRNNQVYVPIKTVNERKAYTKIIDSLQEKSKKKLSDEKIAKALGLKNVKKLKDVLNSKITTTSLDAYISEDSKTRFENFLKDNPKNIPSARIENFEDRQLLRFLIKKALTPQEAKIIKLRYRLDENDTGDNSLLQLEVVGAIMDLTGERIRQLIEQAIKKLRKAAIPYN